jgi:hypothetical protein
MAGRGLTLSDKDLRAWDMFAGANFRNIQMA